MNDRDDLCHLDSNSVRFRAISTADLFHAMHISSAA